MTRGKMCVLVGGQYGSEGKGAIARHVADRYQVHVRVGSPNAGHTFWWAGEKHVMQSVPCGWINPHAKIVIGRGALLNHTMLMREVVHVMRYYPDFLDRLFIDAEAGVLDERFHEQEGGIHGEMHARIGSTGEGVGPARIARLERDPERFRRFKDVAVEWGLSHCCVEDTPQMIAQWQDGGDDVLIEGTQGSGLSLLHSHWPYCTSIDTNAAGIISEVGVAPSRLTDVLMVCRTFPIRVAGNSGPMHNEISWEEISRRVGHPMQERTTVTKKVRRVAGWDDALFERSRLLNAPTSIALTFCDYLDPSVYGRCEVEEVLTAPVREFMERHGLVRDVQFLGTGPDSVAEVTR